MQQTDQQAMEVLKEVALQGVTEQRRARRWSIFFKFLIAAYLIAGPLLYYITLSGGGISSKAKSYTAVVDIKGAISADSEAGADYIIPALRKAFKDEKVKGIVLRCNSPGGSPVQSAYIYDEIRRLRAKYKDKPVYAVAADICASGGYYIISAADKIYANKTSLVGSIGVRMDSFGVVGLMEKIGVESRQLTAGKHKAILDPFHPRNEEEEVFIKKMLANTHKHFINAVKTGRGDRLKDDPDIFSGLFWTGEDAKALGLVDDFGSASYVAREVIGAEELVPFSYNKTFLDKIADKIGTKVSTMMTQKQQMRLRY
ncbi:MAG: signal peptide peptidase SppA [Cocleimonas sp.]